MTQPKPKLGKYLVVPALLIVLLFAGYGSLWLYKSEHDETAAHAIRSLIPLLEGYHLRTGSYPERIDLLPSSDRPRKRILKVFSPPELHYDTVEDGFRIRFHQFPLGPFEGYDSRSQEWFCEE